MVSFRSRPLSSFLPGPPAADPILSVGEGNERVALLSVKVEGALSQEGALASLKEGLSRLQQLLANISKGGATLPSGTFELGFITEHDGLIRMVLRNNSTLTGSGAEDLMQHFVGLAMSCKWRFAQSGGQSLVQAAFGIGPKLS
jgi:hypothetical protein